MIWMYKSVVALFLIVEVRNKALSYILEVFLFICFHSPFTLKKSKYFGSFRIGRNDWNL